MTDIEQMKAELEAEGYRFGRTDVTYKVALGGPIRSKEIYVANDGFYLTGKPEYIIPKAYAHLQEQRKLKALEALYWLNEELFSYAEMYMEDGSYPRRNRSDDSSADITYGALRRIYSELLKVRNITADDESDDDESI